MKQMPSKTAQQSKSWLTLSLLELMKEKSFSDITIKEIAEKAQLDRRTFYRHFQSKKDILDRYFEQLCSEYSNYIVQEKHIDLSSLGHAYFNFWSRHADFLQALHQNHLFYLIVEKYNELLPDLHKKFKEATFHFKSKIDLEYGLSFSAGGFWNILSKWFERGRKETPEEMSHILQGIVDSFLNKQAIER
ncbi:TetR/AcrR family transcriptional regulator [Bacillus haynesii]|uniref:TetR/AcrR family transcriptional regulator n=1 Tax=Bacillus haynesii TaxID=1925021 RepID=UPI0003ED9E64|nr:TetR/AcrR family transcriptional regulator [Bacillus haynesii]EWH21642.1 AcrR family transcriptional regulator [Bacillus haynesii]